MKTGKIDYPFGARRDRIEGRGLFRVNLDVSTGRVKAVNIVRSTGNRTLDQSAIIGLRQYQWKPGKWKEIEIPVTFELDGVEAIWGRLNKMNGMERARPLDRTPSGRATNRV